jgi:hypothetical protein
MPMRAAYAASKHGLVGYIVVTALDIPTVDVPDTASPALALFNTFRNAIARATLVPVYGT